MKFEIHRNDLNSVIRFSGEVSYHDIQQLRLSPLERAQLDQPSESAADALLDLELIFRKHREQLQEKDMDKWTQEDERQLKALQKRRKDTHEKQAERLMRLIKAHVPIKSGAVSDVSIYDLRDAMIARGGAFRDALEPFDHMGRPQPDEGDGVS